MYKMLVVTAGLRPVYTEQEDSCGGERVKSGPVSQRVYAELSDIVDCFLSLPTMAVMSVPDSYTSTLP
jgi:hypothetical protein